MVGLSGEERIWTPWKQSVGRRLPWLGVNLVTALGAAAIVSIFEGTISRWTALVAFAAFWIVKVLMGLRVSEEEEREGLDITAHGERAYTS